MVVVATNFVLNRTLPTAPSMVRPLAADILLRSPGLFGCFAAPACQCGWLPIATFTVLRPLFAPPQEKFLPAVCFPLWALFEEWQGEENSNCFPTFHCTPTGRRPW